MYTGISLLIRRYGYGDSNLKAYMYGVVEYLRQFAQGDMTMSYG